MEGAKVAQWKRSGGTEFLPFTQIKRTPKADELREVVIRLGVCKSDVQIVPVRLCQDVCLLKRQRAVEDAIVQGHCLTPRPALLWVDMMLYFHIN